MKKVLEELGKVAKTLDADGDEHGCAAWLRAIQREIEGEGLTAPAVGSVPDSGAAVSLCDWLYRAGYVTAEKERDYDPRGHEAWQACHDAIIAAPPDPAVDEQIRSECADELGGIADQLACWSRKNEHGKDLSGAIGDLRDIAARIRAQQKDARISSIVRIAEQLRDSEIDTLIFAAQTRLRMQQQGE